jgi:hypothetical protein
VHYFFTVSDAWSSKAQKAAEQAMPANAVAGPAPATGVVPPPEERGGMARKRLRGVFLIT